MDLASLLKPETEARLTALLQQLNQAGGTQLQVVTVADLGDSPIEEATIKMTDQYKLGSAKGDNGILLLVAAKERRLRIEVGQGREGDLPDARANRIIQEVMIPRLREGSADNAIWAGVMSILHFTDPDFLEAAGQRAPARGKVSINRKAELFLWLVFFIFLVFSSIFGRTRRGRAMGAAGAWGLGSGWGGGGGFGGGGFGGGGGGWSGGGGGFSGGGSSGSW